MTRARVAAVLAAVTALALGRGLAIWAVDHYPLAITLLSAVVLVFVWDRELSDREALR